MARESQGDLDERYRYRPDGIGPAAYGRMEQHLLLSVADRHAIVADHLQLLFEPVHAQDHEHRIALYPIRHRLHRLRMVVAKPKAPPSKRKRDDEILNDKPRENDPGLVVFIARSLYSTPLFSSRHQFGTDAPVDGG